MRRPTPPVRPFSCRNARPPTSSLLICGHQTAPTWARSTTKFGASCSSVCTRLASIIKWEQLNSDWLNWSLERTAAKRCRREWMERRQACLCLSTRATFQTFTIELTVVWDNNLVSRLRWCMVDKVSCIMTRKCVKFILFLFHGNVEKIIWCRKWKHPSKPAYFRTMSAKTTGQGRRHGRPVETSAHPVWSPSKIWLLFLIQCTRMYEISNILGT